MRLSSNVLAGQTNLPDSGEEDSDDSDNNVNTYTKNSGKLSSSAGTKCKNKSTVVAKAKKKNSFGGVWGIIDNKTLSKFIRIPENWLY